MREVALLRIKVPALRKANEELSKQRRAKNRIYDLEGLLLYNGHRIY